MESISISSLIQLTTQHVGVRTHENSAIFFFFSLLGNRKNEE